MFSGVGGGGGARWMRGRGRKCGLRLCGEGRRIVGIGVSGRDIVCGRTKQAVFVEAALLGVTGPVSTPDAVVVAVIDVKHPFLLPSPHTDKAKAGKSFLPQNARQNSTNLSTNGPSTSMHPSNQLSQLTLQLGKNALFRSTTMNFGCMTLNGFTNTLLTCKSSPRNSSGAGSPSSETHVDGG